LFRASFPITYSDLRCDSIWLGSFRDGDDYCPQLRAKLLSFACLVLRAVDSADWIRMLICSNGAERQEK
jgi:hypothetical protein